MIKRVAKLLEKLEKEISEEIWNEEEFQKDLKDRDKELAEVIADLMCFVSSLFVKIYFDVRVIQNKRKVSKESFDKFMEGLVDILKEAMGDIYINKFKELKEDYWTQRI